MEPAEVYYRCQVGVVRLAYDCFTGTVPQYGVHQYTYRTFVRWQQFVSGTLEK